MVQDKYIQDFTNWCLREHIRATPNNEIFFINERRALKPMFKLGNNVFVHIVDKDVPPEDEPMYQTFAHSFQSIIVIPKEYIDDMIRHISRKDINTYFKISI